MTGDDLGEHKFFDQQSDCFFPVDEPTRTLNPVADIPYADDEIEEVQSPITKHVAPSNFHNPSRTTRSRVYDPDNPTESDKEDRALGGLVRKIAKDETPLANPMTANKSFIKRGSYHVVNTLENAASSRSQYVSRNTKRTLFSESPDTLSHENDQARVSKRGRVGPSPSATDRNTAPNKKARHGSSPMQGRTKHDAISVDDSQEQQELRGDELQFMQAAKTQPLRGTGDSRDQSAGQRGARTGTQNPARQRSQNGNSETIAGEEDVLLLPNDVPPKQHSGQSSNRSLVNLADQNDISDDEKNIGFMHEATQQRKAKEQLPSLRVGRSKIQERLKSPYFTSKVPAKASQASDTHDQSSSTKRITRSYGSQSPDVLQQGTTTQDPKLPPTARSVPAENGISQRSASEIAVGIIVGNADSTKISRKAKPKLKQSPQHLARFEIKGVRYHPLSNTPDEAMDRLCFFVDMVEGKYYFDVKEPIMKDPLADSRFGSVTTPRSASRITQIKFGGGNSGFVQLKLSNFEGRADGPIVLDLGSHGEVCRLIGVLQKLDPHRDVHTEEDGKMTKIFTHAEKGIEETTRLRIESPPKEAVSQQQIPTSQAQLVPSGRRTRQKPTFIERLETARVRNPTIITPKDRELASRRSSDEYVETKTVGAESAPQNEDSGLISHHVSDQHTRTRNLRSSAATEKRKSRSPSPKIKFSKTGGLGDPWKSALVYPKDGKRRESIGFDDLWRLDEDEFLNDTLIGFFLRYLQHRTEVERPDVLKKMHFFNSYFFDSLNKGTKSAKSINYEAVARWTRNIDLFTRDFVIVPVNESAHWFVAIICNLSFFKPKKEEQEAEDEAEEPPSAVTSKDDDHELVDEGQRANETQKSFEELTIEDRPEAPTSSIPITSSSQNQTPTGAKAGRGRKKKIRRSLPKYEIDKPVVITLDSLGIARSNTCSVLKQYIVQEAKGKGGFDITESEIRGMTAKGIPTQGNYSDCGLYMCMYLEQFICDPYRFVEKLLQREESEIRWPCRVSSDKLRTRMRNLLLNLHRQQEGEDVDVQIPELGKILVDMREPTPEPELEVVRDSPPRLPSRPTTSEGFSAAKKRFMEGIKQPNAAQDDDDWHEAEGDHRPISSSRQKRIAEESLRLVDIPVPLNQDSPIVIDDDGSPVRKKQRLQSTRKPIHEDPSALIAYLREARGSPAAETAKADRQNSVKGEAQRGQRSQSVSTDFLTGTGSYAPDYVGEETSIGVKEGQRERARQPLHQIKLAKAVPETQPEDEGDEGSVEVESLEVKEIQPPSQRAGSEDDDIGSGSEDMLV